MSIRKQCTLLGVSRSSLDYKPVAESEEDLRIKRLLDEIYLRDHPTLGAMRGGLERWFDQYNGWQPHEALGNLTPDVVYAKGKESSPEAAAA